MVLCQIRLFSIAIALAVYHNPTKAEQLRKQLHCLSDTDQIGWVVSTGSDKNAKECVHEPRIQVEQECLDFLHANIMPFDLPISESLGFPSENNSLGTKSDFNEFHFQEESYVNNLEKIRTVESIEKEVLVKYNPVIDSLPDGLDFGIVQDTIKMALDTKKEYYWAREIPKELFLEYVLPFANVDEARNHWRPILMKALDPTLKKLLTLKKQATIEEVVESVNKNLWSSFQNVNNGESIKFRAGQTPLIYDPMSVILNGYGSCTGLSIMLVDALRTAGVPARIAGTPAWNGKVENGNHSWVEYYSVLQNKWIFIEAMTRGIPYNACSYWFCNTSKFDGNTQVFAARYRRSGLEEYIHYPMQWDIHNHGVAGEDRTKMMTDICTKC